MNMVELKVKDLKEYPQNARDITEQAVDYVAWSIEQFGYNEPIIVDKDNVIVTGHVRRRALLKLGWDKVTVAVADDLSPEQIDAFRLADNKVASMAIWDKEKLQDKFDIIADRFSIDKLGFDTSMFKAPDINTDLNGDVDIENTSTEVNLDDYEDEKFKHVCPHCGLKFN